MYKYGYFNEDGSEFVITDPKTPRAFDNFLWNDSLFSSVHQTGVGFLDYQIGNLEAVKLLTGIGRICDFDVFGRDGLMSRLVYIRNNKTGEFWNLNWEPVKKEYKKYTCTHGLGYTIINTLVNNLNAEFRIFVPKGKDPLELWTLQFINQGHESSDISIFVYNQFIFTYKWGFDSYGDMLFRTSFFSKEHNALIANKHPQISPHNFQTAFITADRNIEAFDGSRDAFVGIYNQLNEPVAVMNGQCNNTDSSSDSTIGAVQFNFKLEKDKVQRIQMILGITDQEDKIPVIKQKYLNHIDEHFLKLKEANQVFIEQNAVKTPDPHLNRMLNIWIKHQTSYGAKWCRWGWMGYRDIVQHGFGVSSFNPQRTKEILIEAFKHQYSNGMALRGWNPVDEKPYSDSALWLVFTLVSFLRETGEMDFLEQQAEYYDAGSDTVLNHIRKALDFLENNKGNHGLCLIKFGDWNDSLTAIGKEGRGESVWLSMAYAEALRQMADLFGYLKKDSDVIEYSSRYENISSAINENAWDGKWYVRCFDDNGRPIGSDKSEEGKIFLNAQSWAMISGIANEERTRQLIESSDEMLSTPMGYRLLAPTFMKPDEHIGRISYLEPGICENGTVYSHVNAWMVLGLLRAGFPDKAYETFKRITPGYVNRNDGQKQNMPPYIYANGYFGPDHKNNKFQMEFTWITGSVAWWYNLLYKEMIGIRPSYSGLAIKPCLPAGWDEVTVKRVFRGKQFNISIHRSSNVDELMVTLNEQIVPGGIVLFDDCMENNIIHVFIPMK